MGVELVHAASIPSVLMGQPRVKDSSGLDVNASVLCRYVRVCLGSHAKKTKIVFRQRNPMWQQKYAVLCSLPPLLYTAWNLSWLTEIGISRPLSRLPTYGDAGFYFL